MSFAYHAGAIARVPDIPHVTLAMPNVWVSEGPNAVFMHIQTGHDTCTSGHAYRGTGAALAEYCALSCKAIEMWRDCDRVACIAHGVGPLLIGENKNDVWFSHG